MDVITTCQYLEIIACVFKIHYSHSIKHAKHLGSELSNDIEEILVSPCWNDIFFRM